MDKVLQGIGSVVFILVVIAAIVIWLWLKQSQGQANNAEGVTATLKIPDGVTLRMTATELIEGYGGTRHRIAGLVARVEEGGTVNRRFTVTRIVALGVLAAGLPKRIDDRTLYLTIEGPNTVIVHEIPLKKDSQMGVKARTFAAKINAVSKASPSPAPTPAAAAMTAPTTSTSDTAPRVDPAPNTAPNRVDDLMGKLRELAQLRDSGLISQDEYAAKRVELLQRF